MGKESDEAEKKCMAPYVRVIYTILTLIVVMVILLSINDEVHKYIGKPNPIKKTINDKLVKKDEKHPLSRKCGTVGCAPCKIEYDQKMQAGVAKKMQESRIGGTIEDEIYPSCFENMVYI